MSKPDMFKKTEAHRGKFNEDANREAERRKLPPETQARIAELEATKRDILAAITKKQEARAAEDYAKELNDVSKPASKLELTMPGGIADRSKEEKEEQAAKNLAGKNRREKDAATSEIDREIDQLERPETEKNEPEYDAWATTMDAAASEFTKAPDEPKPEPKSLEEASRKHDLKARWAEAKENDGKGR